MSVAIAAAVVPGVLLGVAAAVMVNAHTNRSNAETYASDVESRKKDRKKKRQRHELQLSGETPAGRKARKRREKVHAREVKADALIHKWMAEAASEITSEQDAVWDKALGRAYDTYAEKFEDVPDAYREQAKQAAVVQLAGEIAIVELVEMEVSRALTLETKRLCKVMSKF